MPYWVYIIESATSAKLYIGQTNNIGERLLRHNKNQNKYTKNKGPWVLIHSEQFETRAEAMQREKYLKSLKNKKYVLEIIEK